MMSVGLQKVNVLDYIHAGKDSSLRLLHLDRVAAELRELVQEQ